MKTAWNPALTLAAPCVQSFGGYSNQPKTWGYDVKFCPSARDLPTREAAQAAAKEAVDRHLAAVQAIFAEHAIEIVRGDKPYPSSIGYDRKVIIDGEHRATFRPSGFSRGYNLRDLGDEGVKLSTYDSHQGAAAEKQEHFLEIIAVALSRGLVPTQVEVDARKAAYEERIAAHHRASAQAAADHIVKGKVGEMLALVRKVAEGVAGRGSALAFLAALDAEADAARLAVMDSPDALELARYEVANNRDRRS